MLTNDVASDVNTNGREITEVVVVNLDGPLDPRWGKKLEEARVSVE